MDKWWDSWTEHSIVLQIYLQSHTYHIIQETKTMVASLNELKKRIRSSPSWPSFFNATPKTRANSTSPRIFIPSISVPTGICRGKKRRLVRCKTGTKPKKRVTSFCCCLTDLKSTHRTYFGKEEPILLKGTKQDPDAVQIQTSLVRSWHGFTGEGKGLLLLPLKPSVTWTRNLPTLLKTSSTTDAKQHGHQSHVCG